MFCAHNLHDIILTTPLPRSTQVPEPKVSSEDLKVAVEPTPVIDASEPQPATSATVEPVTEAESTPAPTAAAADAPDASDDAVIDKPEKKTGFGGLLAKLKKLFGKGGDKYEYVITINLLGITLS